MNQLKYCCVGRGSFFSGFTTERLKTLMATFLLLTFSAIQLHAAGVPVTARFFIGTTEVDPKVVNTEMTTLGLEKVDSVGMFGLEATHSVFKYFDFGFRYSKRYMKSGEEIDNPATDYYGELNQDTMLVMARISFIKSSLLRADIFGGYGGSNTKFKLKTAGQEGELIRKADDGWFAEPYSSYGASVSIGYKRFYFYVEGGYEDNVVGNFRRTGNVTTTFSKLDLSGSYVAIGVLFDGLESTSKR